MNVKVITDSTSDIPSDVAQSLDIEVVPMYVRFGDDVYKDGVDLQSDEFYRKMADSAVHPTTSQPSPEDFAAVYRKHMDSGLDILSVHISSKLSGTLNSAYLGRDMAGGSNRIEIIDSSLNSMGLGLVAMAAARSAIAGDGLSDVVAETNKAIARTKMLGMFRTLKYMVRGGRVSRAQGLIGSLLSVKPMLTFRDGEVVRAGAVRTVQQGIDRLFEFAEGAVHISDLAIVHSQVAEQAQELVSRLSYLVPEGRITVSQLGPALGVHGGPGVLLVALRKTV